MSNKEIKKITKENLHQKKVKNLKQQIIDTIAKTLTEEDIKKVYRRTSFNDEIITDTLISKCLFEIQKIDKSIFINPWLENSEKESFHKERINIFVKLISNKKKNIDYELQFYDSIQRLNHKMTKANIESKKIKLSSSKNKDVEILEGRKRTELYTLEYESINGVGISPNEYDSREYEINEKFNKEIKTIEKICNKKKQLENKVVWKGSHTQILALFELLNEQELIDKKTYENRTSKIRENFIDEKGNNFSSLKVTKSRNNEKIQSDIRELRKKFNNKNTK